MAGGQGSNPKSWENLRPIKPGEVRNPGGMTKTQRENIKKTGEKVAAMQALAAESLERVIQKMIAEGKDDAVVAAFINTHVNQFARDALDRDLGKAQGSLDLTNSDETMRPTTIRLIAATQDDDGSRD